MNSDIRVAISFRNHRKRKRLRMVLGPGATDYLLDLWLSAAMNRPSGILHDMDETDIALDAGWDGAPEVFVSALADCGFLDRDADGTYALHDWARHQGYVVHAPEREAKARKAANARWAKHDQCPEDARSIPQVCPEDAKCNAPSPSPAPSPKEEERPEGKPTSKAPPSAAAAYEFELPDGQLVRLLQRDLEKWEKSYRHIDVYAELQAIADKSPEGRAKWTKANWFQTLSAWLRAANTRAKAADPTFDPGDPTGEKRRAREDQEQREYFERHGIPTATGPTYSQDDYLHGRVPGCIGYKGDDAEPVQPPEGATMNPSELVAQVAAKLHAQESDDAR